MRQVRGTFGSPEVTAVATLSKASISSPVLPRALTALGGRVLFQNNTLHVENLEGTVGKKGSMLLDGQLALTEKALSSSATEDKEAEGSGMRSGSAEEGLALKMDALEVRARNVFRCDVS